MGYLLCCLAFLMQPQVVRAVPQEAPVRVPIRYDGLAHQVPLDTRRINDGPPPQAAPGGREGRQAGQVGR